MKLLSFIVHLLSTSFYAFWSIEVSASGFMFYSHPQAILATILSLPWWNAASSLNQIVSSLPHALAIDVHVMQNKDDILTLFSLL